MKIKSLLLGTLFASAVASQGALIFQMDFNDADGNQSLVDRGTTGVTGTFSGATYSTDVAPVNSGGFSGSFSSSGDVADFGDIDALDGLSAVTITAWIKADAGVAEPGGAVGSGRIVNKRVGSTGGFDLYYHNTDNQMELVADGTAGSTVFNGGGAIAVDQWVFVAVTWTGGTATFYTGDGTTLSAGQVVTGASHPTLQATTASLLLGNNAAGDRLYQGLIDNVRIYDSVEDAASLQSIMQFDDTDLVFQMDFNDADGNQSLVDRGTTGATGSFTGGSTYSTTVPPSNAGGFSGSFNGSSGAANFGDINALDGLSTMTITAWIQMDSAGENGAGRIVQKRSGTTSGFDTYYHSADNELEFVAKDVPVANGGGAITFGQWKFIAMTYDGTDATFYTGDGTTLSAADTVTINKGGLGSNSVSLLIGNTSADTRTFDGLIDNVRIYKTVKDAASLQTIMQYNDAANAPEGPTVTLSTAVDPVDSAYTVDVTFSADVSGLEASDFVVTNGTASGVSPATGPASSYTVTITPAALGTVTVQLPAASVTDSESLPNFASNVLNTISDDPKRPITVRVAAYNVEFGSSATPEQIGALLLPYNLDIIGFNEVPDGDWTARVGAVLGMDYTYVGTISSANHTGPQYQDITGNYDGKYKSILSRTPLEGTNEFTLTGTGWNPASAVRATTRIDGNSVAFYSLHISGNNGSTNSHAYKLATEVLPQETADRVIVVGDFNNRIGDFNINSIEQAGFQAIWTDLNIDVTQEKTYNAQDPNISHGVIDHIFYNTSAGATVADGGIIEEENPLSDHKPLWAKITFPNDISINNFSFEEPKQASDGGINTGAVTGWSESGGTIGNFNVSTDFYTTTDSTDSNGGVVGSMDSTNALFFASTSNESVSQTLSESIVVGNTYTLTVAVGDRDNGGGAGFAGYTIQLRDGDSVLKTVSSNTSPGDGTFTDVVLNYTAQAGDSGPLGITIGTTNAGSGRSTDFDNVRLSYFYYTPSEQWRLLHFGSILNSGNAASDFDVDNDGQDNLYEFTFGSDPNSVNDTSHPISFDGTTLVVTRRVGANAGLSYILEESATLEAGSWTTVPNTTVTVDSTSGEFETVSITKAVGDWTSGTRNFLRLRVVETP